MPRIQELRNSIQEYSDSLKAEQESYDGIKSEALSYVGKLQLSAAMLAPAQDRESSNEQKSKRSKTSVAENETVSPYLQQTDTVNSYICKFDVY